MVKGLQGQMNSSADYIESRGTNCVKRGTLTEQSKKGWGITPTAIAGVGEDSADKGEGGKRKGGGTLFVCGR